MSPIWLIAERELRTYVATASFWIALAVGPLLMAGMLALAAVGATAQAPPIVSISTAEPALSRSAAAAVVEAAATEGRRLRVVDRRAAPALVIRRSGDGSLDTSFGDGFPLSPSGRALVVRTLERSEMIRQLKLAGTTAPAMRATNVRMDTPVHPRVVADPQALSRLALVMALWLVLTGSLGMLLQAVVRERSNRALESLLASAEPWQIVCGKLAGVGAVSMLVLAAWLGSGAAVMGFAQGDSAARALALSLGSSATLARAGLVYILAFTFYGSVTVALGAVARDSADAQNLSRPMFAVLLAAFFAVLFAALGAAPAAAWLIYLPPFTPFMLLLSAPGTLSPWTEATALGLLAASSAAAAMVAARSITLAGGFPFCWSPSLRTP